METTVRYAGSYEFEHGLERPSSRMRQEGPRATAFFPDAPSCCTSAARMLYKMFQGKWMVRRLAAQSSRMYGLPPGAPELRGNQYGGFAPQYAARAQALLQLLVYVWLLPVGSLKDAALVTDALASPPVARRR